MAIISEVNAACNLVVKAKNFINLLREGLYKGSTELDVFPAKVLMLSMKQQQWNTQLKKFGMTQDEHLKPLIDAAAEILDKEEEYVQKMKRSRLSRFKRRVFPGMLTYIFDEILAIVKAGPELIATRVENHVLLTRSWAQTPAFLPFDTDLKYVPLTHTITEVQKTLEDPDGLGVVTVYGGPGIGKSSLVKYIGLKYQTLNKKTMQANSPPTSCFPDGVHYLFCGKGAGDRLNRLQQELLDSLGFPTGSSNEPDDPVVAQGRETEYMQLPSNHTKLRLCLAEQKLLVILDDVWEVEVVQNLVIPSNKGVRYLVTSQIRGIYDDATQIQLKAPSMEEARKILASHTKGLPSKCEFPDCIQSVTDTIIEELEHHPLSLANVGVSINKNRATDPKQWEVIKSNLRDHLDENYFFDRILVYGRPYDLRVSASMMLMVDSLPPDARRLLFLFGLIEGPTFPEVLVKFFFKIIQPAKFSYNYATYMNYLEDRSLVELAGRPGDEIMRDEVHGSPRIVWAVHSLRTHYMRMKNAVDVRSVAVEILGGGDDQGGFLLQSETLAVVMGALHFEKTFRDVVATKFQNQVSIFNGGVLPRSVNGGVDALDLVERAQGRKREIGDLVWLLDPDGGGGRWRQQAFEYANKIITRFICQGELDDQSMARLLQLPRLETTSVACTTLQLIYASCYRSAFHDPNRAFSISHVQTMNALLAILHDTAVTTTRRAAAISALGELLEDESNEMIRSAADKWAELLAKDSSPVLQRAATEALSTYSNNLPSRASVIIGEFSGVLDQLLMLIVEGHDADVQRSAAEAIADLSLSRSIALKIAAIPGALETLFRIFLASCQSSNSNHSMIGLWMRYALENLSCVQENRIKFREVEDGLKDLAESLANYEDWDSLQTVYFFPMLGNLALEKEVRGTIAKLPEVSERLWLLQFREGPDDDLVETWGNPGAAACRALTILDPLHINIPPTAIPPASPVAWYGVHRGRAEAFEEMGMYKEALRDLDMALHCLFQMQSDGGQPHQTAKLSRCSLERAILWIRFKRVFLKAMVEDYAGALIEANHAIEECFPSQRVSLGERGVLHRLSGDLANALKDLNGSLHLARPAHSHYTWLHFEYSMLKNRGLVKHLMGDDAGARADAESAQELSNLNKEVWDWAFFGRRIEFPQRLVYLPVRAPRKTIFIRIESLKGPEEITYPDPNTKLQNRSDL